MRKNNGCVAVLLGLMGIAADAAAVSEPSGVVMQDPIARDPAASQPT